MNYALTAQQQTNHHSSGDNIMKINKYINCTNPHRINVIKLNFTFMLPCIVIDFFLNN